MKLLVITGQTATGKTKLAQEYAKKMDGELINADSRQIYKYLDIITGKDVKGVRLYDLVDPKEYFSSFDYKEQALSEIHRLNGLKKVPIIVGGTYLYIKHLLYDVETERILPDWKLRKKLESASISELQETLKKINLQLFETLNNSDRNNPQRLIRKIEIASSNRNTQNKSKDSFITTLAKKDILFIGLRYEKRENLLQAIVKRVDIRLAQGAIQEVTSLLKKGYTEFDPGLKTIGYQQVIKYVKGLYSYEEMKREWITREMQYAKRQYTFMKKDENIKWKVI